MPQTPEERRKTFEQLAERRRELLESERAAQEKRVSAQAAEAVRQRADSIGEQNAAAARGSEREAWRKEQHMKKEEALDSARKAEAERARQAEKKANDADAEKEKTARMRALHERAVTQKTAARKLQAEHGEQATTEQVNEQLERDLRDVQCALERTIEHLKQDRTKQLLVVENDTAKQTAAYAERYAIHAKTDERRMADYKRAVMTLEDHMRTVRVTIDTEHDRLKNEATMQAEQKKARLRSVAAQRLREAATRRESADEWTDSHRSATGS